MSRCATCPRPARPDRRQCQGCADRKNAAVRASRAARMPACPDCGGAQTRTRPTCPTCLEAWEASHQRSGRAGAAARWGETSSIDALRAAGAGQRRPRTQAEENEVVRRLRERRSAQGLCFRCGAPALGASVVEVVDGRVERRLVRRGKALQCRSCLDKVNDSAGEIYRRRKALGQCRRCGEHAAGRWLCPSCQARRQARRRDKTAE